MNPVIDPNFSFMTVDHDGRIRMDPSSPYAMARLVGLKDRYHLAFANDPDADPHGIVAPSVGLTENSCKIYAESFVSGSHLDAIVAEARAMVDRTLGSSA